MTTTEIVHEAVNPRPKPGSRPLPELHDLTLARMIALHVAELVPEPRRQLAGIPALTTLEAERRRREASRVEVAS